MAIISYKHKNLQNGLEYGVKVFTRNKEKRINNRIDLPYAIAIPQDVQRLEYIQSNGTQYIDTGVIAKSSLRIQIEFNMTEVTGYCIVGYYNSDSDAFRLFNHQGGCYLDFGNGTTNRINGGTMAAGTKYSVEIGNRYVKNLDSGGNIVSGVAVASFKKNENIYIFGNSDFSKGKIYSCKIYDGNNLLRDFVPVLTAAGVTCLYDQVSEALYTNAGTGAFIAGPEA